MSATATRSVAPNATKAGAGARSLCAHFSLPLVTAVVTGLVLLRTLGGVPLLTAEATASAANVVAADAVALALIEPGAGPDAADGHAADQPADHTSMPGPAHAEETAGGPSIIVQYRGPEELRDVAESLARRQRQVEAREADLAVEAAALRTARDDLAADLARLEGLKREMENLVAETDAEEAARVRQLVKLYESMKPKNAAAVFNRLTLDIVVPVLRDMREARAGAILQSMDPARAGLVTVELAKVRPRPRLP